MVVTVLLCFPFIILAISSIYTCHVDRIEKKRQKHEQYELLENLI